MVRDSQGSIILSLDVGTSSMRAFAFSASGSVITGAAYEYAPTYHTDGRVRQSPEDWDRGALSVIGKCVENLGNEKERISAISITSQRASLISIDGSGNPLHDAIMWHDKTTSPYCQKIEERIGGYEMYRKTGLRIDSYFTAPKILWLRDTMPDVYSRAETFLGVQDWVVFCLTGWRVTDYSQASRTLLFNIQDRRWDPEILNALDLDEHRLPETVPPGTVCSPVSSDFAEKVGLPDGVEVVLAGGDQQVAAVGMGIFDSRTAEANTGTGSFVLTAADTPAFHPEMKTLCSCAALPDRWVAEAGVLTSGIVYDWFNRELGFRDQTADNSGGYEEINNLISSAPPGAHGVITLPHFKGTAAPFWNQNARGLFFNMTLSSSRGDLARSVVESIALEIGANIKLLNEIDSIETDTVIVAGGMTSFSLFNQIQADVFGMRVRKSGHTEASSFGAFLIGLAALDHYADVQEAYTSLAPQEAETEYLPNPRLNELYSAIERQRTNLYNTLESAGIYDTIPPFEELLQQNEEKRDATSA